MAKIRIRGLVREANRFRAELARPLTPAQQKQLEDRRLGTIRQIEQLLREHRLAIDSLPAPSRRALEYLRNVKVESIASVSGETSVDLSQDGSQPARPAVPNATFPGLRTFTDRLLDDIAVNLANDGLKSDAVLQIITNTASRLERGVEKLDGGIDDLTEESRGLLTWFRCFAEPRRFESYIEAVRTAHAVFQALPANRIGWVHPVLVHFRPLRVLYRWKQTSEGTRLVLAPPAVVFDRGEFEVLGPLLMGNRASWRNVTQLMMSEPYQTFAAFWETLGEARERTQGAVYDLASVFERVNATYFDGQMKRPKLTWSRTLTGRTFGHYEFIGDTVMISSTLDRPDVPAFVIEHVMHHELLHKKHGIRWEGNRQHAHTAAFRAEERRFARYEEADRALQHIARQIKGRR